MMFDDAEHVTPQATHARYEGEAHAQPSASAVCTIQNIVVDLGFCFFLKLWSISQDILHVALRNKPRRHSKQQRSEERREKQIHQFGFTFYKSLPSWQTTTHLLPVVRCGW